jgi:hypothetical protein
MPFSDIIRLKRLEDVLEKYWNSHRLDHSVKYLIRHVFESPFDFFQEFGDYWEERGWQKIGHQLEDLFIRLQSFLLDRGTHSMDIITGLMKLDYFLGHKYKPRKIWWDSVLDKADWSKYLKEIAAHPERITGRAGQAGFSERDLQKFTVLEVLPFRLAPVLESISGLRADAAALTEAGAGASEGAGVVDNAGLSEAGGSAAAGAILADEAGLFAGSAHPAVLTATAEPSAAAAAPAGAEGSTLLIVMYQQDDSQRAQYYTLPL